MGVREFDAWCSVTSGQDRNDPDSWDGYEDDPWWQDAHRRKG